MLKLTDAEIKSIEKRTPEAAVSAILQAPIHIQDHWLEQRAIDLGMRPGKKSSRSQDRKRASLEVIAADAEAARVAKTANFLLS